MSETKWLLETRGLVKRFPASSGVLGRARGWVHAVNGVDLCIAPGEVVGLVGESGCGKTTLGKTVVRLLEPTEGQVIFDGRDISHLGDRELAPLRKRMQIVFQDPYGSLNPRATVASMLSEAVRYHGIVEPPAVDAYVDELLALVGLPQDARDKYAHEFSGGQRQRIGIARALSVKPDFILADEPVSALDVSIQAQILNLLSDLRKKLGLTFLFISHDLKVVEHFCDRVVIMYLGRIVESLPTRDLSQQVAHPYSRALLDAVPTYDPEVKKVRRLLSGDVPSPVDIPSGCAFHGRCPRAQPECSKTVPILETIRPQHLMACPVAKNDGAS